MTLIANTAMGEFSVGQIAFLGVSTGKSSIHEVFEPWARCLGKDVSLRTSDLPIGAARHHYREFVSSIRSSAATMRGALITSHKAAMYDGARDLFDEVSTASDRLGEIGMIYWHANRLIGDANDAVSTIEVARPLLLASKVWRDGTRNVVILGGGGAGLALANTLVSLEELGCRRVTIADTNPERIDSIRRRIATWQSVIPVDVVQIDGIADHLVSSAGPGSLVANATGLGKDRPGSPVSENVLFPEGCHAWEFNYRFLEQPTPTFYEIATKQASERRLIVRDGWEYFIWGWLVVMATATGVSAHAHYDGFRKVADRIRPVVS